MNTGNTETSPNKAYRVMLAPLAGYTDVAFRTVCGRLGAEYAVTEMISAKAVLMNNRKTFGIARVGGLPTAVQLFGAEPETVAEAARIFSGEEALAICGAMPAAIDINMGCPMHKIVSNGEGSALMREPLRAAAVISAAVRTSRLPVTVKIRSGWDADHINAPYIAHIAEECGAAMLTVHARTREQMYSGKAERDVIAQVKRAVKIPVIGNGDIRTARDAEETVKETGCDGVMIGRGAVGNPFIFREIAAARNNTEYVPADRAEIYAVASGQFGMMLETMGNRMAVLEARKHFAAYLTGIPGAAAARQKINTLTEPQEILAVFAATLGVSPGN